jgi:single-strand DNA-binding protein
MIIGNLGQDPEMRYTPSGKPVTTFSVATNRSWNTSSGKRKTETEWFTVVAWSSLAEICKEFLSKGKQVYIEGRLQTRHWEDKEGKRHSAVEIVANEMILLDQPRKTDTTNEAYEEGEDEFPF